MRLLVPLSFVCVFAVPGLARAAEPAAPDSHPVAPEPHAAESQPESARPVEESPDGDAAPAMRRQWYGWQTLSADGAALLLLLAAAASADQRNALPDVFGYGSGGLYLFGGFATHLAHDSPGRALGSLGLRAGLPIAFGAVGSQVEDCSGDNDYDLCGIVGFLLGGVLGIATAITLDATVLAYEEVPVPAEGLKSVGVSLTPSGAQLVVGGTF